MGDIVLIDRPDELFISFFVACYNERANIYDTLETLNAALSGSKFSFEIIVVDDASEGMDHLTKLSAFKRTIRAFR